MTGSHIPVAVKSQAIVRTGGGGGWGDPLERDPAMVAEDVSEGFISVAAAKKSYGVVLRGNLSLDEGATKRLRDKLRSARKVAAKNKSRHKSVKPAKAQKGKGSGTTKGRKRG